MASAIYNRGRLVKPAAMAKRIQSAAEQVADALLQELMRGRWTGTLPGIHCLSVELGLPRKPVERALELLEKQGVLVSQGVGKRRKITLPKDFKPPALQLTILHYQDHDPSIGYILELQHRLMEAGHNVSFSPKSLLDLNMDVKRVQRLIKESDSDAWIVFAGHRKVLEWFAEQSVPAFAMFGQRRGLNIAGTGPDKVPALIEATQHLISLGHRKISMLVREEHRKPEPGPFASAFLDVLHQHGIPTGPYNLPDWDDNPEDFRRCIDSLFEVTPPTALILDEEFLFNLAQHYLARKGILAPQQVSLICSDPDPTFGWSFPSVAHIHWETGSVVNRIVQWADNVAKGIEDLRQSKTTAKYVQGGTVGPVTGH